MSDDVAANEPIVESTADQPADQPPTPPAPPPPPIDELQARFDRLRTSHPDLTIARQKGFGMIKLGTYPVYQQRVAAPFLDENGQQMEAVQVITLSKADWIGGKREEIYKRKNAEAIGRILDWVESMQVPVKWGSPDMVEVSEWGVKGMGVPAVEEEKAEGVEAAKHE